MSILHPFSLLLRYTTIVALSLLSLISCLRLLGHRLQFTGLRPGLFPPSIIIYHPSYSFSRLSWPGYSFLATELMICLHLPRADRPRWASIWVKGYYYTDTTCSVSINTVEVDLLVLPRLFRASLGPIVKSTLRDFRLLVFSSQHFPHWVELLRKNLLSTILTGEQLRLDDFNFHMLLGNSTSTPAKPGQGYDGDIEKPGIPNGDHDELDEARLSVSAVRYHVRNWQGRMYTFGAIDTQIRRSWVEDRGSFVMIAEESLWTKVPAPETLELLPRTTKGMLVYMFMSFGRLLSMLGDMYTDPMCVIDLYVTNADIKFDDFRTRDAEVVRQTVGMLKARYDNTQYAKEGRLGQFAWDAFVSTILHVLK